jgi:hypothetical protein
MGARRRRRGGGERGAVAGRRKGGRGIMGGLLLELSLGCSVWSAREEELVGKKGKRRGIKKREREKNKRKEKMEKLLNLDILGRKIKDNLWT